MVSLASAFSYTDAELSVSLSALSHEPRFNAQVDLDQLDQNKAVNKAGGTLGRFNPVADNVSTDSLQPYSEVWQHTLQELPLHTCVCLRGEAHGFAFKDDSNQPKR